MKRAVIPGTVRDYEMGSFYDCHSFACVIVCEDAAKLNNLMFCGDADLKYIVLPDTLETINSAAFYDCANLEYVCCCESTGDWNGVKISGDDSDWLKSAHRYYYSELESVDDGITGTLLTMK